MAVLAGIDFFTVEVLTWRGLVTYYVLFFLHLETRRVSLAGITRHPMEMWMEQMARNAVDEGSGYLCQHRYVLHDRDTKPADRLYGSIASHVLAATLGADIVRVHDVSAHVDAMRVVDAVMRPDIRR